MNKLRRSAFGQDCLVRLPGICNFNKETTVLAHLNGGGMGMKKSDIQGAFCCSSCHDEVDRRTSKLPKELVELEHRRGVERTQDYWVKNGLLKF
jgi:hypothetical protein